MQTSALGLPSFNTKVCNIYYVENLTVRGQYLFSFTPIASNRHKELKYANPFQKGFWLSMFCAKAADFND